MVTTKAIAMVLAVSFKAGVCYQWCHDFPDHLFEGGTWNDKTQVCRCYSDFSKSEMNDIMHTPYTVKKSEGDNPGQL